MTEQGFYWCMEGDIAGDWRDCLESALCSLAMKRGFCDTKELFFVTVHEVNILLEVWHPILILVLYYFYKTSTKKHVKENNDF